MKQSQTPTPIHATTGGIDPDLLLRAVREAHIEEALDAAPLLTAQEVADRLSVCLRTVTNMAAAGELVPIHVRSSRRFTERSVADYIASRVRDAHDAPDDGANDDAA